MSAYIDIKEKEPEFGEIVLIKLKDGSICKAWKTESGFDTCGYLFEDIHMMDHKIKDIVAWKKLKGEII